MNRPLLAMLATFAVSFNGWSCSDTLETLPRLACEENGRGCLDSDQCCTGICLTCMGGPGICVELDGGAR